jgi:hypothetical protein
MEDELILSEENQLKLSSILKKMQDNKESQQDIDYITSEFKRERGEKMTAGTQEAKKKYWQLSITIGRISFGFYIQRLL